MPTGYTAKLMEEGKQSFPEFAMQCARAFGACITMRDSPMDDPIPEEFKENSYHTEAMKKAMDKLLRLKTMDSNTRALYGLARKRETIKSNTKWLDKEVAQNSRLDAMMAQVENWTPPTHEHQGLKDFMKQQLEVSHQNTRYVQELIDKSTRASALSFYDEDVRSAKASIRYHAEEQEKEKARNTQRTEWVKKLRQSLR